MAPLRVCDRLDTCEFTAHSEEELTAIMLDGYGKHRLFEHLLEPQLYKPYFDLDRQVDKKAFLDEETRGGLRECIIVVLSR